MLNATKAFWVNLIRICIAGGAILSLYFSDKKVWLTLLGGALFILLGIATLIQASWLRQIGVVGLGQIKGDKAIQMGIFICALFVLIGTIFVFIALRYR